jgi:DNA-binding transcriptional MerR regulator/methylmalonyl-CoA mutase cobalamin-binding subunit
MYNLNPNTLRTWERRYGIVKPLRSDGGHRGYSESDLVHIESMVRLLNGGMSAAEAARQILSSVDPKPLEATARAKEHRIRFREAVKNLDQALVGEVLCTAHGDLGYAETVENVLFPELVYWGEQWEVGGKDIAPEHLATFAVRAYLSNRYSEANREASGPCVTLAVAPGDMHDLPLVHVANLVGQSGVARPLLLVGGLPISEVVESAVRSKSACIVLSATITPRPELVRQWIAELSSAGWESRTVLAGAGFSRSRVFSESQVRSAPGNYSQIISVLSRVIQGAGGSSGRGIGWNGRGGGSGI